MTEHKYEEGSGGEGKGMDDHPKQTEGVQILTS